MLLVFGTPVLMGAASTWSSLRTLRIMAGVLAADFLLAMLTMEIALPHGLLATELNSPWILQVTALGTTAVVLAWRPWVDWTYVVAVSLLVSVDRIAASLGPILSIAWQDGL